MNGIENMNTQKPDAVEQIKLAGRKVGSIVADAILKRERQIAELTAERDEYKRIAEELIDHYGSSKWECSYCEFHHTHRDCDERLFIGGDGHGPRFASDRQQEIYSIENPE